MDRATVEAVIEEHGARVFTLAVYLLHDREEAEDVTQEVLIQYWQRGREVPQERLGAWLLRVTRNRCIDRLRTRRSRLRWLPVAGADAVATVTDSAPGPEARVNGSQLGAAILRALADLHEPYRSVVILREIQGLAYDEIADTLEMPLSTVRVTLHRGRRRLRAELREEYEGAAAAS
jgi:RNA polymerase sigma-70 factor (ECF subfamily)